MTLILYIAAGYILGRFVYDFLEGFFGKRQ